MEEKEINDEDLIIYGEYQKPTSFPNKYEDLVDHIMSLFHIPEEKKSLLIIAYKNESGDSIKITSQEEYSEYLLKKSKKELKNIILISLQEFIQSKIKPFQEDIIYDKDNEEDDNDNEDIFLRQGHVFEKNNEAQSEFLAFGKLNINKEIENSNENNDSFDIDNMLNNNIVKSVLPPATSFPSQCNICQKFPILKIMYFCSKCQLNFCEDCEKNLGYNHRHCYYKIRNKEQYQEILKMEMKEDDINNKSENEDDKDKNEIGKNKDKSKEKKENANGIFSSLLGFMSGSNNNNTK